MSTRKLQKAQTRLRILESAAALFRKNGYTATGVDAVMERAGLTAGGFYSHFRSKAQLLAEVLAFNLGQSRQWATQDLGAFFDQYLSPTHRDHPEKGCPLVGLAAELAREGADVRAIVATHLEGLLEGKKGGKRTAALATVSTLVGAVLLARMSRGDAISDEILSSARKSLRP